MQSERRSYPGVSLRDKSEERVTLRELIDTCLRNCANSYRILALEGENLREVGISQTSTRPSHESYASNVLDLDVHIPDSWKNDKVRKFETETQNAWLKGKVYLWPARQLHHAIIELLIDRKDLEEIKLPRTLID